MNHGSPSFVVDDYPKGRLVVLAGPSGVGKTSVVSRLHEAIPEMFFSVSATTRDVRPGETQGSDYHFVTDEEFDALIADGGLLEWAVIHDGLQRSGTPVAPIAQALEEHRPVLVEVDLAGAQAIKQKIPWSTSVFLMPPDWHELKTRLEKRGSESPDHLARRLKTARWEMLHAHRFDHVIINNDLDATVDIIARLLKHNDVLVPDAH